MYALRTYFVSGAFWRLLSQHRVKSMFTAPTAFRAIRGQDPTGEHIRKHDLSAFKYLFLAGASRVSRLVGMIMGAWMNVLL